MGQDKVVVRETAADKPLTIHDCAHRGKEIRSRIGLYDIAVSPGAQGSLDELGAEFDADEDNLGVGRDAKDWLGDVDAIELGKPNVQEDQVRLQLFGLLNSFDAV